MEKTIKEIFKDYDSNSFSLNTGRIKSINLFKKTNNLELVITADEFIKMEDIYSFEQYLKKRFNIFEVNVKIEYNNKIDIDIEKEWNLIICYMAHKHPLSKAFLKNSSIQIDGTNITVNMTMKGKMVLDAKGFDKALANIIENIYGLKYKIIFVENISEEATKLYMEHARELEKQAIMQAQIMAEEAREESQDLSNSNEKKENTTKEKSNAPVEEVTISIEVPQEKEETSPLIYGRSLKLKEQLVKVIDLSIDSGKLQLDGEILNID